MLRSIDTLRSGMLRQQQHLDVTAHNIANHNTDGFKAMRAMLESGEATMPPATGEPGEVTPPLPAPVQVSRLHRQGAIRETGVATDMAIEGEGFFPVRRADGSDGYTRNGAFRVDAGGRLTLADGQLVYPPSVIVPPNTTRLDVGTDGKVVATLADGSTRPAGELPMVRFANPSGLMAGPDGLYAATAASGAAEAVTPGQNGVGAVRAGALEGSNSDLSEQMTQMIAAQRAYQMNLSAFRMSDDMLRIAAGLNGGA